MLMLQRISRGAVRLCSIGTVTRECDTVHFILEEILLTKKVKFLPMPTNCFYRKYIFSRIPFYETLDLEREMRRRKRIRSCLVLSTKVFCLVLSVMWCTLALPLHEDQRCGCTEVDPGSHQGWGLIKRIVQNISQRTDRQTGKEAGRTQFC